MRPTFETLLTCGHPLDLINDQRRDMIRRHEVEPNALLVGRRSRVALKNRKDSPWLYDVTVCNKWAGYQIVFTEESDQFEFAYLPSLESANARVQG